MSFGRNGQDEVDACAVGSEARLGVDGFEREALAEKSRGAGDIAHLAFHLLDALAGTRQEARERASAASVASGQNIQAHAVSESEFKFPSVEIGRNFAEARRVEATVKLGKTFRRNGDPDGK